MGLDFRHECVIARDPAEVFAYLAEFENNPAWQSGMVACRWTSETRYEVGSTYVQEARFLGRRIDTHFEVVAYAPFDGARGAIEIASTVSTFPIQVTRSVTAEDGFARVEAHIRGQPRGLMALFGGMVRRSVAKDYARLREQLEGA